MSISKLATSNDWILISTTAITAVNSIQLTNFGNYKDLIVLGSNVATGSSSTLRFTINNSTSILNYFGGRSNGTVAFFEGLSNATTSSRSGGIMIENVNSTGVKRVYATVETGYAMNGNQFYYDGAAATTIEMKTAVGSFTAQGNIYLFGRY